MLLGGNVYAVEYGGVGANPANPDPQNPRTQSIFVYKLDPGAQKSDAVRIVNSSDTPKTIAISVVDSETSTGGALACKQTIEAKKEVGSWVTLQETEVTLAAHKTEVVPFTLSIPSNASVGEHNGCLVVQDATAAPEKTDQAGVTLSFRSALRMSVTINGNVYSNLLFEKIDRSSKGGVEIIHPYVKNDGNVSVDATISVSLNSLLGNKVVETNGSYPVLAKSTADWSFELKRPFWGGFYKVVTTASYPADPTKALGIPQDQKKTATAASQIVWVTPSLVALLLELLVVAGILGAIVLVFYRRKVISNWQEYEIKKNDTLQTLAQTYGVNWRLLARINKIRAPYHLEAGKWIRVPKK